MIVVPPSEASKSTTSQGGPSGGSGPASSRVYVTTPDGVRLHGRRWLPRQSQVRASLLFVHGIASHSAWFAGTAAVLAERGIAVYAPDRRGSGQSSGPRGHIPSYERAAADVELFVDLAAREQSGRPLFLAGSSWAARLALAVAARRQDDLAGLVLLGPVLFSRVDLTVAQKLFVLACHHLGAARQLPIPLFPELYTRHERYVQYIRDDTRRLLTASARFFWETRRLDRARDRLAAELRLPLMVQIGAADRIADATATTEWVDQLPIPDRARYLYAGAAHTLDFEPEPMVSVYRADLLAWLDQHIRSRTEREAHGAH